jgi:glycosyltransferase involved in cell wall biosynthesis
VRVLHIDPEGAWGGGETQVAGLLRELAARGHESVLAAAPGSPIARAAAAAGIPVVAQPITNNADVRAVPTLRRLARAADVVHFHTARAHAMAPWLAGVAARRIVTRRMDYVPRGGPWARFLYNRAVDRVIAISDGVRAALLAAGVEATRIRVVPSGVDVAALAAPADAGERVRAEWGVPDAVVLVGVVGALESRKGHATLIEAAARLAPSPSVCLVFCGSGSQEGALRAQAAARGVAAYFAGFRPDVGACLAALDLAVLPSLKEGLGVAALEAMAAGRAVVASRVGGLAEVVVDGETGRLVAPGDVDGLAAALATLVADAAVRRAMGEAGRRRVAAHYSMAAMAAGTLACYLEAP